MIIATISVIVNHFKQTMTVRTMDMGMFQRPVRATQPVPRHAGEETQLDQQGEDDGTGETHADGATGYAC